MGKSMLDPHDPIIGLLDRDQRYRFEAYVFIFEALRFAQDRLEMGEPCRSIDSLPSPADEFEEDAIQKHVSGQDLCEAIRHYALDQYGLVAQNVLAHWGIRSTGDIGEIVFNLIDIGKMKKTENDHREDFENVYDFDEALRQGFRITLADPSEEPQT